MIKSTRCGNWCARSGRHNHTQSLRKLINSTKCDKFFHFHFELKSKVSNRFVDVNFIDTENVDSTACACRSKQIIWNYFLIRMNETIFNLINGQIM